MFPGSLCGSLVPGHRNRVLPPGFSLAGILDGIAPGFLPWWPHELTAPWWEHLPRHLSLAMAAGNPSGLCDHTLFTQQPPCGQTFSDRDMGGEAHQAPTWGFCPNIDWH